MTTIEEIFNLSEDELKSKLIEYEDEIHYSNNLKRINAVIIHSFNNSLLNSKEMEIVESNNYDRIMKSNPTSYSDFLNLLKPRKKINININPQLLKRWNTPKVTTLEGHTNFVTSVAVSGIINTSDNIEKQYIISGSSDKTIKIWDLSTFKLVETLEGHTEYVTSVAVISSVEKTADLPKKYIISGSADKTIKIWDLSTFKLVETLEGHTSDVASLTVSSKYIISGSFDKTIKIWDLSTFKLVETLEGHTDNVNCVAVSDKYIISGSADTTIKIWDLSTFELVETLEGHIQTVLYVAVSGIINTTTNKFGKQYIISGSDDNTIRFWDLSTFKLVKTLEGHTRLVSSVAVSSVFNTTDKFGNIISKQYIISGSYDSTIKIWDISTFKLVSILEAHTSSVTSVTVSSVFNTTNKFEKQYIISGSKDRTIKIWEQN